METERDGVTQQEILDLADWILTTIAMRDDLAPGNPYRSVLNGDLADRAEVLARWVRGED